MTGVVVTCVVVTGVVVTGVVVAREEAVFFFAGATMVTVVAGCEVVLPPVVAPVLAVVVGVQRVGAVVAEAATCTAVAGCRSTTARRAAPGGCSARARAPRSPATAALGA